MNINLDNPRSLFARLVLCLACGLILAIGNAGLLRAQSDSQEQQKQEPEKKEAQTPPAAAVSPSEGFRFGVYQGHSDIEIGYRWVSDTAGSKEMYRSMVNLGEGPRVLHSSISLRSDYGSGILFDHLDLSFDSWGGDPYNTMRLNFGRSGAYEFSANYRNLIYYNFVPTWANPLIATGYLVDQHAEHVDFRGTDIELKFFTSRRIRPYVAYSRSSGFGPGLTTFSLTGNEFVLGTQWHYSSDDYRGGVEFVLPRLNLTLEEGYRFLKNDTSVNQDSSPQGNTPVPFLGNPVVLNALGRGYHDRTTLPVSKAVVKFTPFDNLKITGRYIYTMSDLQSTMGEIDTGSLVSIENRLVYSASSDAFNTRAKQPNHNGSFLIEYSPFSRLTFLDQFETRSYHVSGDALLASVFLNASSLLGPSGKSNVKVSNILGSLLAYDQLSNQAELEYDLGQGFTLRGGHRYTYAEATLQSSENGSSDSSTANFGQHTGIAGVGFASWPITRLILAALMQASEGSSPLCINAETMPVIVSPVPPIGSSAGILEHRYEDGPKIFVWRSKGCNLRILWGRLPQFL